MKLDLFILKVGTHSASGEETCKSLALAQSFAQVPR